MIAFSRLVFFVNNPDLTFPEVKELAGRAGFNILVFKGRIYTRMDDEFTEIEGDAGDARILDDQQIFCVMDAGQKSLLMVGDGLPLLTPNFHLANQIAQKEKGFAKTLGEAQVILVRAMQNVSPIIVPEEKKIIVPANG